MARKLTKKGKKLLLKFFLTVTLVIYLVCKIIYLNIYKIENNALEVEKWSTFTDNMTIKNSSFKDDFLELNNIRIGNFFNDFKVVNITDTTMTYHLDKENKKAVFVMGTSDSLIDYFTASANKTKTISKFAKIDRQAILKKRKITNDVEFLEYIKKNIKRKSSIFTSFKKIKENYAFKYYIINNTGAWNSISMVDGDYIGYIFNSEQSKEIKIIKNNNIYSFTFWYLDYFTHDRIKQMMNSLVIN